MIGPVRQRLIIARRRLRSRFWPKRRAVTKTAKYREATERGLDFLLKRQYENGGWPQRSPLEGGRDYGTHITLNDGAMLHVLELLRAIESKQPDWAWLDEQRRQKSVTALERGIECLLKMQIKVGNQLTVLVCAA